MERADIERARLERLMSWIKGKPSGPVRIDLEPTSTCNLRCRFCWTRSAERFRSRQYEKLLTEERIVELIYEGKELGVIEWQIAGGWEPLVRPKLLMKIARAIKEGGMYGCITTSGTLFTDEMIKKLVEMGWDEILFSLEGPNAEIHDYVTCVKGSFRRSTWAMKRFGHWKKKLGKKKPDYSFHAVLTNLNFDKLSQMVVLGSRLGCRGVNFEPLSVWSEEGARLQLNAEQRALLPRYVRKALKAAHGLGIFTNAENLLKPALVEKQHMDEILKADAEKWGKGRIISSPCFEPWLGAEIRITGRVAPCRLCDDDAVCDQVHENSLEEVWFGPFLTKFREAMLNRKMPNYCYTCAVGNVVGIQRLREKLLEGMRPRLLRRLREVMDRVWMCMKKRSI
jgi:MoaA/NifB/PqqE/SkfB family radical SAM enzyme